MDLDKLRELDLNTIGDWPDAAKAVGIAVLCACVAGAWYYFDTRDQLARLEVVEQKETQLRASFEAKQQKAANLAAYRDQLEQMRESFGAMLRQLPDRTEVASLLVDVSQTGLAAGLEFELFQPSGEQLKDFYAEYPIDLRVTGRYHEFGRFISGLAALPRIVTIHNVNIAPQKEERENVGDPVPLALQAQVKTYRYLDEETVSLEQEVPQ